jgi:hypothetical protein
LKPVVPVPLWLAVPAYVIYAVVWAALVALAIAFAVAVVIGYGIVAVVRRRQT